MFMAYSVHIRVLETVADLLGQELMEVALLGLRLGLPLRDDLRVWKKGFTGDPPG